MDQHGSSIWRSCPSSCHTCLRGRRRCWSAPLDMYACVRHRYCILTALSRHVGFMSCCVFARACKYIAMSLLFVLLALCVHSVLMSHLLSSAVLACFSADGHCFCRCYVTCCCVVLLSALLQLCEGLLCLCFQDQTLHAQLNHLCLCSACVCVCALLEKQRTRTRARRCHQTTVEFKTCSRADA